MLEILQNAKGEHLEGRQPVLPHHVLLALALGLTFVAYCGTVAFQFVLDDHNLIVDDPILRSWRFLPQYFTQHLWASVYPGEPGNYYRPVFLLWLRLNYVLFGLAPWGWHLTTLSVHLGATLLVYWLASKIVGDRLTGALAALIFGVHPVHVESVAWVSGVIDPLVTLLFLASFLSYVKKRELGGRGKGWAAASLLLYAIAMLAKENALALPLVILAYEWIFWPEARDVETLRRNVSTDSGARGVRVRKAIKSAIPYIVLTSVYLPARVIAVSGFSHAMTPLPLSTVVYTCPSLAFFYLRLLVWPAGLSILYDRPIVTTPQSSQFLVPLLGLASVVLLLWARVRKARKKESRESGRPLSRVITFACAWVVLPTLPVLNVSVFPEADFAHDRYLYLPSVGFAILVALALRSIEIGRPRLLGLPAFQVASVAALALVLVPLTTLQTLAWASDLALLSRTVAMAPNHPVYKVDLANALVEYHKYDEAISIDQQVLSRSPGLWWANFSLGFAYYRAGKLSEAAWWLNRAISIDPHESKQFLYLGLTELRLGNLQPAASAFRQAIRLRPDAAGSHFALGTVLKIQGDLHGAIEEFKAELVVNPDNPTAREQLTEVEMLLRQSGTGNFHSQSSSSSRFHHLSRAIWFVGGRSDSQNNQSLCRTNQRTCPMEI